MKHRVPRGMGTLSDAEVVALLKAELRRELGRCCRRRKQVFLDLFGGTAGVTAAIRKLGYGCICFELTRGQQYDLTCRAVLKLVKGWISSGVVIGASVATPCSTFSRARRGKPAVPDSGRIVRSRSHPWGILSLSPKERIAVDLGNATARASIQIIKNLTLHGLPVILENPINSQLFYVLQNLMRRKDCTCISTDQCQFGARWRKRTRLCCWNIHDPASLARLCTGKKGLCSRSLQHHIVLTGSSPSGVPWSRLAQTYTPPFARAIANALALSADEQYLSNVRSLLQR